MPTTDGFRGTNWQIRAAVAAREITIFVVEKIARIESSKLEKFIPSDEEHRPADPGVAYSVMAGSAPPFAGPKRLERVREIFACP